MGGKHSVKHAKKVVLFLAELGNVAENVIAENAGWIAKLMHLVKLSDEVIALSTVKFNELKLELGELDELEKQELIAIFQKKFDLGDDKVEALVEKGLGLATEGSEFVSKVIAFSKELKA